MPAPANVPEFLDLVRRSGLIPDERLDQLLDRHRAAGTLPPGVDQLAALLVREGLLTFFQAKQLKLGRYKRFTIGSKYRLLELIGAGGMGAVYLCEHTLMRRLVALKVLPVEKLEDPSSLERFYREARAVAALDHPNIVRAYDIDQFEKLHFLVMEYVDGTSLQEIVGRHGPMDPIRAAHYIAQSAVGMQHAHELGMVHRDIKPGNLLLERTGVIKILDMGLARFFNKQQDNVTEKYDEKCVLGTADYLAPEQAVSSQVDIRADIYSLGGTLYFLLTGQTPFPDGTIAAKLVAHQTREPKAVESFRKDVPPGLLAVLRAMLAKKPEDRYQTPIEVAEALTEWADRPIDAPPAREMPGLCPLVLALTGHVGEKSGSAPSLARSLFGPGRGVFARGGPGSNPGRSGVGTPGPGPGLSTASYPQPTAGGSTPRQRAVAGAPGRPPASTARATGAATAPLPPRPGSQVEVAEELPREPGASSVVIVVSHRRTALYVALGVLAGVLAAGGAVAAYFAIKSARGETSAADTAPDRPRAGRPPAEVTIPSAEARRHVDQVRTVELTVRSVSGAGPIVLSAEGAGGDGAFSAELDPDVVKKLGFKAAADAETRFKGKTIRVRGMIAPRTDTQDAGVVIRVRDMSQVSEVGGN